MSETTLKLSKLVLSFAGLGSSALDRLSFENVSSVPTPFEPSAIFQGRVTALSSDMFAV